MAPKTKKTAPAAPSRKQPARPKKVAASTLFSPAVSVAPKKSVVKKASAKKATSKKTPANSPVIAKTVTTAAMFGPGSGRVSAETKVSLIIVLKKNPTIKKDNAENCEKTKSDIEVVDTTTMFPKFDSLPLEVRTKIWGFAAPDPYVIHQRESFKSTKRWTFARPVPGVLHACRESRYEFLEKDDGKVDITLARRKLAHPVYKLFFGARRTRSPRVFFSAEIDTLWGRLYMGAGQAAQLSGGGRYVWRHNRHHQLSGVGELDVASNLRHLTTGYYTWHVDCVEYLVGLFPKLETLTTLLREERVDYTVGRLVKVKFPPEVAGQVNTKDMTAGDATHTIAFINAIKVPFDASKKQHPTWKLPALKFRAEKQYIENEGIVIETKPEDPLDSIE